MKRFSYWAYRLCKTVSPVFILLFVIYCNAVLAVIGMETMTRATLSDAVFFILSRPLYSRLNIALVFLLSVFLFFLSRRLSLSMFLSNLLCALLALTEVFKVRLRSGAFVMTDLLEVREALGVIRGYNLTLSKLQILALMLMFLIPALCFGIRLSYFHPLFRIFGGLFAAVLLIICVRQADLLYYKVRIGSYGSYYSKVGLAVGFIGTRPREMMQPEGYSKENVIASLSGAAADPEIPDTLPDIFFVMCESLFDPAKIDGLTIDGEVFPNLSALMREGYGGNLLVSQFGGGTAQTEYEVLTGYRAEDTSGGAYMTPGALKKGMQSLPQLFREYGYYSEAMHPSSGQTYKRKRAYSFLGFDRGIFKEEMSEITAFIGDLPADSWFFPEILRQYEARPENRPYFSYIVTFQNHGGYIYRTVPHVIRVTGPNEPALTEANNFVNGLALTDQAIGDFCETLRASDRPVVVVLFGDHCPSYSLFDSHPGSGPDAQYRSHTTPLLIWSNFGLDLSGLPQTITTYRLAAEIANLLGFKKDAYLNSLLSAEQLYYTGNLVLREDTLIADEKAWQQEDARLKLLHYDRLVGNGWSLSVNESPSSAGTGE